MTQIVLSYFPLTNNFKEHLEAVHGPTDSYQPVSKIRNLPLGELVKRIRQLEADRLLIAIEDDNSRPLVGPLRIVAAATRAHKVVVVWPDTSIEYMPRRKLFLFMWRLLIEQIKSRIYMHSLHNRIRKIGENYRSIAPDLKCPKGQAVFLDANLSFGFSAGGAIGHIKGVIDGMITQGWAMRYVSTKPMPTNRSGAKHIKVPAPNLLAFPAELNYYSHHQQFNHVAHRALTEQSVDFIYQRLSLHNFSGVDLAEEHGVPLVVEYNGSEAWTSANWGQRLALHEAAIATENYTLHSADLIVTVSDQLERELLIKNIPANRILTYPNCIDPKIFSPERFNLTHNQSLKKILRIAPEAKVATFIGTFGVWHGIEFLAHAIRDLINSDRAFLDHHKLHFLLIGDGLKKQEVNDLLGRAPYSNYVTLTGLVQQDKAPGYLAISDLFLSPHVPNPDGSPFFGSPTKLFEYMAMEKPIIASDLEQIGVILRGEFADSSNKKPMAYLFPPGDADSMLAQLRYAVEQSEASALMAKRARQYVLDHFTWDHHVGAILARLKELRLISHPTAATGKS